MFNFQKTKKPIKNIIGETIKKIMIKRKFEKKDVLAIIYIIDTDGCLIPKDKVIVKGTQNVKTFYQNDFISVLNDTQKQYIQQRNEVRSRNIRMMNSVNKIVSDKYNYQIYYFSRNLEHVVFNDPNPKSEAKFENIEAFLNSLTIPIEEFLLQYMPELIKSSYNQRYNESWAHITNGTESLKRCTM